MVATLSLKGTFLLLKIWCVFKKRYFPTPGIFFTLEGKYLCLSWHPKAHTMLRCKQGIAQHIISQEDQGEQQPRWPASKFADPAPAAPAGKPCVPGNDDGRSEDEGTVNQLRGEESHVCEKCCVEFFGISEFLEPKKNCTKNPCVLIMNDSEGPVPSEDFLESVLSHQSPSPSRKYGHGENGGSPGHMKEKPGT